MHGLNNLKIQKEKKKIEQLCFIDRVSEHFLDDRS